MAVLFSAVTVTAGDQEKEFLVTGVIRFGVASMDILDALDLQQIKIRLLPAAKMYELYLTHRTMSGDELGL